ncbi:hypothetical protein ADINL_0193 [Nitrincola lacisaponensis]|uniref:DUF4139 domain-containing protein n=1 Tax=Nitrincola lacisaponensis TaxID=267850 RepID=A0A063YAG7_9GAMM|nr:DUF4139 domain-containing protein [Nitrincola lacisaponensis]KDE41312.1 hypothetical protein ADINL_0193 [Nitrincola lacisaponensis]
MRHFFKLTTLALSVGLMSVQLHAAVIPASDQTHLGLTLYPQDLAMVQDHRRLPALSPGQQVHVEKISPQMLPETLRIQGAGQILEQSLLQPPLSYQAMLDAHLGRFLQLARLNPATGQETLSTVELLSVEHHQALVRRDGRIESIPMQSQEWRFIFPSELPANLQGRRGLHFISAGTEAESTAQLNYLTRGMGWQMDYVLTLNPKSNTLSVEGLASVYNHSGNDYLDAEMRLMAGDIQAPAARQPEMMRAMAMSDMLGSASNHTPETVQDFYLYRLPYPVSLRHDETKQLPLIQADALPVTLSYHYAFPVWPALDQQRHQAQPEIRLSFEAPALEDQKAPLPAGQARVFRPDRQGEMQFIGAANLGNLASGETAELVLGRAFDLNITRRQVLFTDGFDSVTVQQEITVTNAGNEGREVDLSASFQQEWTLRDATHTMQEDGAGQLTAKMHLPAGGSETLRFTVELKKRINR